MSLSPEVLAWMAALNKKGGEGTIVRAVDLVVPKRFTTGSLSLDLALGGNAELGCGLSANLWTEIIGPESAGKTALVLKAIAANQARDPEFTTFWVAGEHYDTDQAASLGVDNDRVVVAPAAQEMELALELLDNATACKLYDFIVLDSYPALLPQEEDEKAMDEFVVATGAKLFNKFWRKSGKASRRKFDGSERPFAGIVINQFRDKIGGFAPRGPVQTSPGGHGKDYAFYTRLKLSRKEFITEKRTGIDEPVTVGQRILVEAIKNKGAAPKQRSEIDLYFRDTLNGFHRGDYDFAKDYVIQGKLFGVIGVKGSWLTYAGQQWQSKDAMQAAIREDLDLRNKLAAEVIEATSDPRKADEVARENAATSGTTTRRRRVSK